MEKIGYNTLDLKSNTSTKSFEFNGATIEVLSYLPVELKYDLIMITLQKAKEDKIYNPLKLDMYFTLNLIYLYTNLSFSDEDKENESEIYDTLKSSGFIDLFLNTIEPYEYDELLSYIKDYIEFENQYSNSAAGMLNNFIQSFPEKVAEAMEMFNSFDPEKYQQVMEFAKSANGGRDLPMFNLFSTVK